jgi:hypothetical protein
MSNVMAAKAPLAEEVIEADAFDFDDDFDFKPEKISAFLTTTHRT